MKKILITQRLFLNDTYYELREGLDVEWGSLFKLLQYIPIIAQINYDISIYFKEFDIDGILLTGGNNLYRLDQNDLLKNRDVFEKKLLSYASNNNIPVFGVCRGMQVIADFFGSDFKQVKNQVATRHILIVNSDSKYKDSLNAINTVNSFHNYGISNLSEDLLISATDNNNIIKAIEHKEYKVFGQMWHCERETPFYESQINLVKTFFSS
tara:strand:+ start:10781 stop:11410 length:630 start_codon:yes stop_codon:yes gene_type:complete